MTTSEETKLNNNSPSVEEPHSDLPAAPPLYIKLDWGQFVTKHGMTYVYDGNDNKDWDVRYTVCYIGTKDSKTIKYIHITTQVVDRVDEPLGETHETKITGPLEPQDYCVNDYPELLSLPKYSTLGSIKVVKVIITYMDKTVEEITDENAIRAICFPSEDIKRALPKIKEPLKLAPPTEPHIYMHFSINKDDERIEFSAVYIGDEDECDEDECKGNNSKSIKFIDMQMKVYNRGSVYDRELSHVSDLLHPRAKYPGPNQVYYWDWDRYIAGDIQTVERWSLNYIVITYEDNTYIEIPKRMIEAMISDDNFEKADKKLEEILQKAKEAKKRAQREAEEKAKQEAENLARQKAEEKARRDACCAEIKKYAVDFLNTPNDLTAESLLNKLNEYCPNDEVMAANYLTKDDVASACGKALQMIVFYTNNNVVQPRRDAAKSFLERIAPDLISEKAFDEYKNDWSEKLRSEIDSHAHNFLKQPDDFTAASLLAKLNAHCPNDDVMAANYLTKDIVTSACGKALQMIVFNTNNNVTQSCRDDAKSFLKRIAPDLISEKAFDEFKNDWSEKLRSEIDSHAHSFLKKPNDINAESLLNKLNEYCPNDVVMATNYLTKEIVISACGKALQMIVFNTNNNVTQAHRDGAKSFLKHIAPELYSIESRAHIFLNQHDDLTAASLLAELNAYCPNDDVMAANYLTKDIVTSACGKALQMIVFNTNNNVTQAHRDDAKSFLNRLAPQLNSMKSYKRANSSKKINGCLLAIIIAVAIVVGLVIIVTFMGILIAIVTS